MNTATSNPVRFDPSVEHPAPDEGEAIAGLEDTFRKILETTSNDYGHAVRGVHAKGHGLIRGRLIVMEGLPPHLAQGLFARPDQYDAILRLSTAPGDILDDSVSAPRGAALKVFDVVGDRLPGAQDAATQDFLMVNGPVFGAPTPAAFLKNLKLLAATTDKAEGLKKAWSATLRTLEGAIEAMGGQSVLLSQLGGAPETHPLGDTYYSQAAFRYGDFIAKLSLAPVSAPLKERADDTVHTIGRPDALREDIGELMIEQGGTWELRVQLCTDLDAMPVEDPTILWDEKASPFIAVARFEAAPQTSWENGVSEEVEDTLSYSPWHGLAAHRPLGAVNRARRPLYEFAATFRSDFNGCPIQARMPEDVPA